MNSNYGIALNNAYPSPAQKKASYIQIYFHSIANTVYKYMLLYFFVLLKWAKTLFVIFQTKAPKYIKCSLFGIKIAKSHDSL